MNEENRFSPKKRWTRIFRKKWFFPSLYLMLAALLISAVVWYQTNGLEETEGIDEGMLDSEDYVPVINEDAEPVMGEEELIQLPVANLDEAEIVTNFFDYNADAAVKANALIHYNNRYYQSTGVDIARQDEESFDVVSSLSGTVSEVKQDPLMGNVVIISHDNEVTTYYASLEDVVVSPEDEVKQGEVIGKAGKNAFGKDNGNHVHFELRKAGTVINPEEYVNQPLANLDQAIDESETESNQEEGTELDANSDQEEGTELDANNNQEEESDPDADNDREEESDDVDADVNDSSDEDNDREEETEENEEDPAA